MQGINHWGEGPWKVRVAGAAFNAQPRDDLDHILMPRKGAKRYAKRRRTKTPKGRRSKRRRTRAKSFRRSSTSRAMLRFKINDLINPPKTLKLANYNYIEEVASTNKAVFFMGIPIVDHFLMNQWRTAVDDAGNVFFEDNLAARAYQVFCGQFNKITNNTDYDFMISAVEYIPRYDIRDCDYAQNLPITSSNTVMNMWYNAMLAELNTADDSSVAFTTGDATNGRHGAYVTTPSFATFGNRTFNEMFKPVKTHKPRKVMPGDSTNYRLVDRKMKKLLNHVHINNSSNHSPTMLAGRARFIMFKVWGKTVGTSESNTGALEDEKISSSTFVVHHEYVNTYTGKVMPDDVPAKEWVDLRDTIAPANQRAIVNQDMDIDNIEL